MTDYAKLTTESHLPGSRHLDQMSALNIVQLINDEDAKVATAVASQANEIARSIELIARQWARGGRLFYLGAGTSGRLGVLDASECPPTFNADPGLVVGLIAGGDRALRTSVEGAEDQAGLAEADLQSKEFSGNDVLVGIATSGRTPYVVEGLKYAKKMGGSTIGLSCNRDNQLESALDLLICPVVGPEVISGSTRMKAGTATKMVLNMLTTGAMVLAGKTYGNLMVDLRASNHKLTDRAIRIVCEIAGVDRDDAQRLLQQADGESKTAVIMSLADLDRVQARELLDSANGNLRSAIRLARSAESDS